MKNNDGRKALWRCRQFMMKDKNIEYRRYHQFKIHEDIVKTKYSRMDVRWGRSANVNYVKVTSMRFLSTEIEWELWRGKSNIKHLMQTACAFAEFTLIFELLTFLGWSTCHLPRGLTNDRKVHLLVEHIQSSIYRTSSPYHSNKPTDTTSAQSFTIRILGKFSCAFAEYLYWKFIGSFNSIYHVFFAENSLSSKKEDVQNPWLMWWTTKISTAVRIKGNKECLVRGIKENVRESIENHSLHSIGAQIWGTAYCLR